MNKERLPGVTAVSVASGRAPARAREVPAEVCWADLPREAEDHPQAARGFLARRGHGAISYIVGCE